MDTPLFTWGCIVALLAIIIIARVVAGGINHYEGAKRCKKSHRFIEIGTESEEFYAPGDRLCADDDIE